MATRSQNKPPLTSAPPPPAPRSPSNKKDNIDEIPIDKRRKIGSGKMVGPANSGRTRQAFSVVNAGQDLAAGYPASTASSECGGIEFTLEDVEALLNEKMKGKNKFDYKGKCEQMTEYVKKLRLCLKWFIEREDNHVFEQEKLKNMVESTEKERDELEMQMKNKEEEANNIIAELRKNYASLEARCTKEEADKLAAFESNKREKDARVAAESAKASLSDELKKTCEELSSANQKISAVNEMYKRLQEYNTSLQQYNSKLQTEVASSNETLKRVEKEKAAIVENLSTLRGHYNSLQDQLTYSRASQEEAIKQREALVNEVGSLRGELLQVRDDRDRQLLQDTCSSQRNQIQTLQHQLATANEKLQRVDLSVLQTRTEYEEQKKVIEDLNNCLADAELQIIEADKLRKKLHNTILELKGNIRVFCRVRPLLLDDGASSETTVISYPTSTEALGRGIDIVQNGQKHPFTFDQVFSHEASQQDVFVEISQLVQSALDGYKVCIFAYGQTGSGKTYTMMGKPEAQEQKGLIPRSLEQIFQISQALISQGWKYKMQASMLEIYNETIRDLLSTNRSNGSDISRADNGVAGKQYAIKHDANGNTYVSDLTIVDVCSINEISSLLWQASQNRSVGKTQMNEQSSRSHFVFTLRISGVNESTEQQVQGVLNLIDLAGSERLSKSGSTGDRLKETQAINLSLKCLSDVIFSLAKKEDHVPFRNSKLTYLLQPCLGGDSKTLMFVNISPSPSSVGESLCSLRFAARVNACEIGIPRRQTNMRPLDSRLSYG
ncbi:kinesin-like protein KIN-14C isoform X2 [Macadamia integrifolia]|uniref:kinesin-like protein KIN-14C isoform X2 n=1 Tax=Macadamia integrifolia TaxID=60698 RepID=UPI001C4E2FC7|nr:kinesin-like protein KIN-14C isoform X2 [Macadamia integrifolia]